MCNRRLNNRCASICPICVSTQPSVKYGSPRMPSSQGVIAAIVSLAEWNILTSSNTNGFCKYGIYSPDANKAITKKPNACQPENNLFKCGKDKVLLPTVFSFDFEFEAKLCVKVSAVYRLNSPRQLGSHAHITGRRHGQQAGFFCFWYLK